MGKKKQLTIIPSPPIPFPKNILSKFSNERKGLLQRGGIWDYLNLKLPKPNLNLIRDFITISDYGKMKEIFIQGRKVSFTLDLIAEALHLTPGGKRLTLNITLTEEEKFSVFGADPNKAKTTIGWDLRQVEDKILGLWLYYLNQEFFYISEAQFGTDELIHMGLFS